MSTEFIIKPYRAIRKAIRPLARTRIGRLKGSTSLAGIPISEMHEKGAADSHSFRHREENAAAPLSPALQDILSERATIWTQIGWSAEQGMVSNGGPRKLLANHEAELAEHRRLLAEEKLTLRAGFLGLAALFPPLPLPVPEPAAPPRSRIYSPLGNLLAQRPTGRLH